MQPIKEQDRPKVIILGILMAAVACWVIYTIAVGGGQATTAAAPAPEGAGATPVAVASNGGVAPGGAAAGDQGVVLDPMQQRFAGELDFARMGPPNGGRDPFVASGSAAEDIRPAPPVRPLPPSSPGPKPGPFAAFSQKPANAAPTVPPMPVVAAPPSLSVTGVVLGDRDRSGHKLGRDVAILHGDGEDKRFVTVGDPVGNGYVVTGVHAYGVDIRNGDHVTTILLASTSSTSASSSISPSGTPGVTTRAN